MATPRSRTPPKFSQTLSELGDLERPLAAATLYQLSDLSRRQLDALAALWPGLPVRRRIEILAQLTEISEADYEVDFQLVAQQLGLRDPEPQVRRAAIEALWEPEDVLLLDAFARLLAEDPDHDVRASAAAGLGRFVLMEELGKLQPHWHGRAQAALYAVLADPATPAEIRRRAVESIGFASDERVPAIIEAAYRAPDDLMRASALLAMGRSADNRWAASVLRELQNENPQMRYEAARAAGEIELKRAVPRLIELTEDDDREVLEVSIWALGAIGGPAARKRLEALSDDEDDGIAEAADEALQELVLLGGDLPLLVFSDEDFEGEDFEDED